MIALVLALCGLLLWFSPAQRVFYSIVAVVLALATFNTINYGGFFIGMLLGIVGGGLAFAWSTGTRSRKAFKQNGRNGGRRPGRGRLALLAALLRHPRPGRGGKPSTDAHRSLAVAALPLTLPLLLGAGWQGADWHGAGSRGAGWHGTGWHAQRAPAVSGPPAGDCLLVILCPPGPPAAPPGSSRAAPNPAPGAGNRRSQAAPPGSQPAGSRAAAVRRAQADVGLVAAAVPAQLTAGSARLVGLGYDGVAEVQRSAGPPVPMMKFSLQSVTLTGHPTLTIHQNGSTAVTSTSLLSFTGHVVLYATRLSGDLLGIPVTLTASSPLSLVLRLLSPLTQGLTVTMTNVSTEQPVTTADASQWAGFRISVRPASSTSPA